MPIMTTSISDLPSGAGVYAMYGGLGSNTYVAYIGIGENLKRRVGQHLYRRDSSVVTGVSAVSLNPDLVTKVEWWTRPDFSDPSTLQAAELIAFEFFQPVLRSRGKVTSQAVSLAANEAFRASIMEFFREPPSGTFIIQSLQALVERVSQLEKRINDLEKRDVK